MSNIFVLLLEDDPEDALIIRRHLSAVKDRDYHIHHASDPEAAARLIKAHSFDVALIDYSLPGGETGLGFVETLGGRDSAFPAILLTGLNDSNLNRDALNAGTFDFLDKLGLSRDLIDRSIQFSMRNHLNERRLRNAKKGAEFQARENQRLLAVVSHELKSPLASLIGYSDFIIANASSTPTRDAASNMKTASIFLQDFLRNLSEYVRLNQGAATLDSQPVVLADELPEIVALFHPYAVHKAITLTADIDLPAGRTVSVDRVRLRQILINILRNAITYTDDGAVTLQATMRNGVLTCEIKDEGIGMSAQDVENLNAGIHRLDAADGALTGGLGIGLRICREILVLMRGPMHLASTEGFGTTVTVRIPLDHADTEHCEHEKTRRAG
ncbi:MAG: hybrid sensor histidine kinase/response regulator [Pseudomonadota bacterium]